MNDIRALTQHEIDAVSGGPGPLAILIGAALVIGVLGGCSSNITVNICGEDCTQGGSGDSGSDEGDEETCDKDQ